MTIFPISEVNFLNNLDSLDSILTIYCSILALNPKISSKTLKKWLIFRTSFVSHRFWNTLCIVPHNFLKISSAQQLQEPVKKPKIEKIGNLKKTQHRRQTSKRAINQNINRKPKSLQKSIKKPPKNNKKKNKELISDSSITQI